VVLGAAYRGGVKETAFSGVFDTVRHLETADAVVTVHDPMYADDELAKLGLDPHALGSPVDAAIVHTDHAEYRTIEASDLPGVKVVIDGRASFPAINGVTTQMIGRAPA
jgi:UDP-N-acetyl-D-mannosaminuronate dehydrogenase